MGLTSLILKEWDEEIPNNYRPITVCSILSKIFAIIINDRLNVIIKEKN